MVVPLMVADNERFAIRIAAVHSVTVGPVI